MWRSLAWLVLAACGGGELAGTYDLTVTPNNRALWQTFHAMTFAGDLVTVDSYAPAVLIDKRSRAR